MENNNGKGIFYGVIGVATLVVAIIGATFAYFTATASNNNTIAGNAATVGLKVAVEKVTTQATGDLIPLDQESPVEGTPQLPLALKAAQSCVDDNDNTVCQVYKITVTNNGNSTAVLSGTLTITGATFQNLKWTTLDDATTYSDGTINPISATQLEDSVSLNGSASKEYFIAIWIEETGAPQNDNDKGSFTGTVSFNTAGGDGVTATFS